MATQTFTWFPDTASQRKVKPSVLINKFGDGYEQRVANGINTQPDAWTLTFTKLRADALTLITFLQARNGVESFNWQNPYRSTNTYICREWSSTSEAGYVTITCSFEQVFE
jgi:phage-related protein